MPYMTKTADTLNTHPGETVTYTYRFYNDEPLLPVTLTRIEDDYFGDVWTGIQIVLAGAYYETTYQRVSDCTTITNKARGYYTVI